jgi:hypothetical protein
MIFKKEFFHMLAKYLLEKNTMILFNNMVLSQNIKNTLFPNTLKC